VSENFFAVLGVPASKGRPLIAGFSDRHVTVPVGGHGLIAATPH
jgi:hypothetical protein